MNDEISFLLITGVITCIFIFWVSTSNVKSTPQQEEKVKPKTHRNNTPKSDTVIDTLDWMLRMGIIDSKEYNKLMGKSLPFL